MYTKSTLLGKVRTVVKLLFTNPGMIIARISSFNKSPLFLFQMGKVASKTHDKTLCHKYFVQHFHDEIEFDAAFIKGTKKYKDDYPYDIITATRDPITRKISAFFQNITADHYDYSFKSIEEAAGASVEELIRRFKSWEDGINEATGWFDKHFVTKTGVDVYASDFDAEQGWSLIESEKFRVLVVKFEDIRKNHVAALNALLARRFGSEEAVSELKSNNLSENKWYSDMMQEFKKTIIFSKEELDAAYESKYMRHFYSAEQIQVLRSKWSKSIKE